MNVSNPQHTPAEVFADPVAYLASLGIEAEFIAETSLPAAA